MKKIIFILLVTFCTHHVHAQMYSQPAKTKVNVEKPKKIEQPKAEKPRKQEAPVDTSNSYLGNGFVINAIFAVNRGVSSGDYVVYYGEGVYTGLLGSADASLLSYRTPIKNNFGYRIGAGFGFQNKKFALEFPFMFCVDRFKVPGVDPTSDNLKVTSIEVGVNVYIKLFKEKHYALIGQNFATRSIGINLGYGYYVTKLFNVSLRFKLDMFNSYRDVVVIHKDYGADIGGDKVYRTNVNSNSLQLVLSYDVLHMPNPVKYKTVKPDNYNFNNQNNNNNNNNNNNGNNNNNNNSPQGPVNYSGYSDSDLVQALKEANTKSDLDAMLAIQKEIDRRKQSEQFSKFSYVQLQDQLNKALDKEDYKLAELIKKEIAKRDEQKGPSNKSESDLSGKTIQELNKLKEEAVLRDDFDRADLIKKEIAKRNAQPNKSDDLNNKTIAELNKLKDEAVAKDDFDTAQKIQQIINKKKQQ